MNDDELMNTKFEKTMFAMTTTSHPLLKVSLQLNFCTFSHVKLGEQPASLPSKKESLSAKQVDT